MFVYTYRRFSGGSFPARLICELQGNVHAQKSFSRHGSYAGRGCRSGRPAGAGRSRQGRRGRAWLGEPEDPSVHRLRGQLLGGAEPEPDRGVATRHDPELRGDHRLPERRDARRVDAGAGPGAATGRWAAVRRRADADPVCPRQHRVERAAAPSARRGRWPPRRRAAAGRRSRTGHAGRGQFAGRHPPPWAAAADPAAWRRGRSPRAALPDPARLPEGRGCEQRDQPQGRGGHRSHLHA